MASTVLVSMAMRASRLCGPSSAGSVAAVDLDQDQRKGRAAPLPFRHPAADVLAERRAVEQLGQASRLAATLAAAGLLFRGRCGGERILGRSALRAGRARGSWPSSSNGTTSRPSCQWTQLRPAFLEAYSASSARWIKPAASSPRPDQGDAQARRDLKAAASEWNAAFSIILRARAEAARACSGETPGKRTANSSPP